MCVTVKSEIIARKTKRVKLHLRARWAIRPSIPFYVPFLKKKKKKQTQKQKKRHFNLRHPSKIKILKERMCFGTSGKDKDGTRGLAYWLFHAFETAVLCRGNNMQTSTPCLKSLSLAKVAKHKARVSSVHGRRHLTAEMIQLHAHEDFSKLHFRNHYITKEEDFSQGNLNNQVNPSVIGYMTEKNLKTVVILFCSCYFVHDAIKRNSKRRHLQSTPP